MNTMSRRVETAARPGPAWICDKSMMQQPRVLVVDDEPVVRSVMQGMLDILGYQVSISTSGVEAVSFLKQSAAEIDYIFCDLKMGGLQGRELFTRIFDIAPCIQLVVMSGRIESDEVEDFRMLGVSGFLSKPFSIETLRNELGRLAGL